MTRDNHQKDNAHEEQTSTSGTPSISSKFNVLSFLKQNVSQPISIAVASVLGATAIGDPLLSTTALAGGAMFGSFYLLSKTSDIVVDNTEALGAKMGIASLALGTILGAVTSMPELFVSLGAMMSGTPEIGVGNIVGSNIANILLILGTTAMINPIRSKGTSWKFNTAVMGGATALFGTQMALGMLNPALGAAMLVGLGAYMYGSYKFMKRDQRLEDDKTPVEPASMPKWMKAAWEKSGMSTVSKKLKAVFNSMSSAKPNSEKGLSKDTQRLENAPKWFNATLAAAGIAGLIFSADFLINSASTFASGMGVSPALIGVLAVAFGTSLPELVVNVKAALKGQTEMAVGNILGSNIFNIMMVGGALSLGSTAVPEAFGLDTNMGLLNMTALGASAGLLATTLLAGKGKIGRWQGLAALALYAAYTASSIYLSGSEPVDTAMLDTAPVAIEQSIDIAEAQISSIKPLAVPTLSI